MIVRVASTPSPALRPLLSEIGPKYLGNLRAKLAHPETIEQVETCIAQLRAMGANDMSVDAFPDYVQRWLDGMRSFIRKGKERSIAAPRTKRKRLALMRAVVHLAMKLAVERGELARRDVDKALSGIAARRKSRRWDDPEDVYVPASPPSWADTDADLIEDEE